MHRFILKENPVVTWRHFRFHAIYVFSLLECIKLKVMNENMRRKGLWCYTLNTQRLNPLKLCEMNPEERSWEEDIVEAANEKRSQESHVYTQHGNTRPLSSVHSCCEVLLVCSNQRYFIKLIIWTFRDSISLLLIFSWLRNKEYIFTTYIKNSKHLFIYILQRRAVRGGRASPVILQCNGKTTKEKLNSNNNKMSPLICVVSVIYVWFQSLFIVKIS